jgi:hypothetical protein
MSHICIIRCFKDYWETEPREMKSICLHDAASNDSRYVAPDLRSEAKQAAICGLGGDAKRNRPVTRAQFLFLRSTRVADAGAAIAKMDVIRDGNSALLKMEPSDVLVSFYESDLATLYSTRALGRWLLSRIDL